MQTAGGKTKYTFDGMDYETEVEYDDAKLLAPRITKTKLKMAAAGTALGNKEQSEFGTDYFYDDLGRLKGYDSWLERTTGKRSLVRKLGPGQTDEFYEMHQTWTPEYKQSSSLIDNVQISLTEAVTDSGAVSGVSDLLTIDYAYGYDGRGNVNNITETAVADATTFKGATTFRNKVVSYTYDGGDKVETENNAGFDINYRYVYNERGQLKEIWNHKANPETLAKSFTYDVMGRLQNAGGTSYAHNNYGNTTSIGGSSISWTRGRYLSGYNGNGYEYNHQGVRFGKTTVNGTLRTNYYLDGSKILGENVYHIDTLAHKLRYFYDATGLTGFTYNGAKYTYLKDALGNITGLLDTSKCNARYTFNYKTAIAALYVYDAWGNCKVTNADGGTTDIPDIAYINPFRWKGFYLDTETNWYYIDGRYYDPAIAQYIDADAPENLLLNSAVINGHNRYGITVDNAVALTGAIYSIFTATKLYTDPEYVPKLTLWETITNWWNDNRQAVFLITLLVSLVLIVLPVTKAFGLGMFKMAMGFAISGAVMGGAMGGLMAAANGGDVWEGISLGAVNGFMDGFIMGAVLYCVASTVKAVAAKVQAANAARAARSVQVADTAAAQAASVQPNNPDLYKVGPYNEIKGAEGLQAHHVGQKAVMKELVPGYDANTAPAINVPAKGHTRLSDAGLRISTKTSGFTNARQVIARDIMQLRMVYPDIPNSALQELINLNKIMYGL